MKPTDIDPAGFGAVPVTLLRDHNLKPIDGAVYAAIASFMPWKRGAIELPSRGITRREIMDRCFGIHRHALYASLERLTAAGYIGATVRRGNESGNLYTLKPMPPNGAETGPS